LLELGLGLEVCPPPDEGFFVGGADVVRLGVDVGVGVDVDVGVGVGVGVGLAVADAVEMRAVAVSPRSPVQRTEAGVTPLGTTNVHVKEADDPGASRWGPGADPTAVALYSSPAASSTRVWEASKSSRDEEAFV
jgi:hypothetical protein